MPSSLQLLGALAVATTASADLQPASEMTNNCFNYPTDNFNRNVSARGLLVVVPPGVCANADVRLREGSVGLPCADRCTTSSDHTIPHHAPFPKQVEPAFCALSTPPNTPHTPHSHRSSPPTHVITELREEHLRLEPTDWWPSGRGRLCVRLHPLRRRWQRVRCGPTTTTTTTTTPPLHHHHLMHAAYRPCPPHPPRAPSFTPLTSPHLTSPYLPAIHQPFAATP